jgi:hypothetical protein
MRPVAFAAWTGLLGGCAATPSAVRTSTPTTTVEVPAEPAEPMGSQTEPSAEDETSGRVDPSCCKGMNECKGQGGCEVAGRNSCRGLNDCKGMGGCRARECVTSDRSCCKGMNECKGQGGCKTEGGNDCAGKNECKGKGGCKHACRKPEPAAACCKGMNECKGQGGCKTAQNACKGMNSCKGLGGCAAHCPR